jgi:hypothetical protein
MLTQALRRGRKERTLAWVRSLLIGRVRSQKRHLGSLQEVTGCHVGGVFGQGVSALGHQLVGSGARVIERCGGASGHVAVRPVMT